jgi:DNA-binding beta-propeller fold protein YncE
VQRLLLHLLLLALPLLFLPGCVATTQPVSWQEPGVDAAWPQPPDRERVRYLRSLSGPEDFELENSSTGLLDWMFGKRQNDPPLLYPFAVAVSDAEVVWVADSGTALLYRFDPARRRVSYFAQFNERELLAPLGVAVDDERGRVYLSDAGRNEVLVLDREGRYLASWTPPGGFGRPVGLAVDADGRLLVADAGAGIVRVFDSEGAQVETIASLSNPEGRFRRPLSVAVGPAGEVLILDAFAFQIEVQDAAGKLLGTIGRLGDAAGSLARPRGVAVDAAGHVFVSDSAFDNIQVFDMTGNLLMYWGKTGKAPGQFSLPAGLFVDSRQRLFVADSYNHRLQAFQLLQ